MKISLLFIVCIPLLDGLGCYSLSMVDVPKEEYKGLFRKGSTTKEGKNPRTAVASHQDQYLEGNIIFEWMVKPFGVGVSFEATTNPPTEPIHTANIPDPTKPKAIFITATSKMDDSKERAPLDVATGLVTPVKIETVTFKGQGKNLSSQRVELDIKGLDELSETEDTDHFVEATTSHILRHWKDNTTVILYNVETNFIPSSSTGHSSSKTEMKSKPQVFASENVFVAQVHISFDFKTSDPNIAEEMIITGAFGTSGTNKYEMTLKDSGVESFS